MRKTTVRHRSAPARSVLRGFTLVELLVVIGIIALLIALLLPALGKVMQRARVTTTQGTMQEFAKACDAYFQEFGEYPGVIPEDALEADMSGSDATAPRISGTENAILALMGGYRLPSDVDYANYGGTIYTFPSTPPFTIKINPDKIGEGPTRNGKKYDTFFSPKGREFGIAAGQLSGSTVEAQGVLPDLLDAWQTPILYARQQRTLGPLVYTRTSGAPNGQFSRAGLLPYTLSTALGELGADQTYTSATGTYSTLNANSAGGQGGSRGRDLNFGQVIRHPAHTSAQATASDAAKVDAGTPRGKFVLVSAGPDGIFLSSIQGSGAPGAPRGDLVSIGQNPDGPRVLEKFDDIVVAGGS